MWDKLQVLNKIDHPNIVQYVQSFEDEKYLYCIQEYIDGKDLFEMMEIKGKYA